MSCFPTNYTSNARDHGPIDGEVPNTIAEQGKCLPNGNGTYAVGQQEAVEGGVTGSPAEGHHPEQQQHLSRSPCRTANMHLESDPISAAPVELRLGLLVKIQVRGVCVFSSHGTETLLHVDSFLALVVSIHIIL